MTGLELCIVGIAALLTSALTAVAGAGGGLVLLVVMLQFLEPTVAIPAHGVIQLVSNGTRTLALRGDAELRLLRWYLLPLLPATVVGYLIADTVPEDAGRALVGAFALVAVWWPAATAWLAPQAGSDRRLVVVGAVAGVTNPTIGAPGPLLARRFGPPPPTTCASSPPSRSCRFSTTWRRSGCSPWPGSRGANTCR
ncbi:MAG: sulfite exporter TauE/SafE family protein [Acidimicrobiales bacterium]